MELEQRLNSRRQAGHRQVVRRGHRRCPTLRDYADPPQVARQRLAAALSDDGACVSTRIDLAGRSAAGQFRGKWFATARSPLGIRFTTLDFLPELLSYRRDVRSFS